MPIAVLRPTGAGSLAEWTPSAGTNWEAAAASGGADVSASAAGTRDRYTLDNLPADASSVTSVTAWARAAGDNLGGAFSMRLVLDLGGTESLGDAFFPLDGGYTPFSHAFPTAPGALAWTVARVNALELGQDVIDTTPDLFLVDAVWLVVDYVTTVSAPVRDTLDLALFDTNGRVLEFSPVGTVEFHPRGNREVEHPAFVLDLPAGGDAVSLELDEDAP
jgi:hypothetical protein